MINEDDDQTDGENCIILEQKLKMTNKIFEIVLQHRKCLKSINSKFLTSKKEKCNELWRNLN